MPRHKRLSSSLLEEEAHHFISGSIYLLRKRNKWQKHRAKEAIRQEDDARSREIEKMRRKQEARELNYTNHSWHDAYCPCGDGINYQIGSRRGCCGWCGCPVNESERYWRYDWVLEKSVKQPSGFCKGCGSRMIGVLYDRIEVDKIFGQDPAYSSSRSPEFKCIKLG